MEISQLIPHVEALIFAADRPLPAADILELLNSALAFLEDRATMEQVEAAIEAIQEKYNSEFYAFSVRESGGGYQFLTKKDYYQTVAQLNGEKFLKRLSTAALETLAIIAYRQPISKGEIEHIRGVSTDYSITKLLEKELIVISGRSEDLPGKPLLYTTSKAFMDYFGLNSPQDLPKLREVFEEDFVAPTQLTIDGVAPEELKVDEETVDDGHLLVVDETGELTETVTVMMDDEVTEDEGDGLEMSGEVEEEGILEGEMEYHASEDAEVEADDEVNENEEEEVVDLDEEGSSEEEDDEDDDEDSSEEEDSEEDDEEDELDEDSEEDGDDEAGDEEEGDEDEDDGDDFDEDEEDEEKEK